MHVVGCVRICVDPLAWPQEAILVNFGPKKLYKNSVIYMRPRICVI